jgi:large subunit ribosomal protein L4
MKIPVLDVTGKVLKQVDLSDVVYAAPANPDLLHQALIYYQANQRQGTHSTLTRGKVSGGGRKPFAQKHTGNARAGTTRSPQARGGGTVFGPTPRSHRKRLPVRMRRQAIRCALSAKASEERLLLLDKLELGDAKTKAMAAVLKALAVSSSALVVLREPQEDVVRAVRNLPRIKTLAADLLNVLDLSRYDVVLMTEDAAKRTEELWADPKVKRGEAVSA